MLQPRFAVIRDLSLWRSRAAGGEIFPPRDTGGEVLLQAPDRRMIPSEFHKTQTSTDPQNGKPEKTPATTCGKYFDFHGGGIR